MNILTIAPYLLTIGGVLKSFFQSRKTIDILATSATITSMVNSHQLKIKEATDTDLASSLGDIEDFVSAGLPEFEKDFRVSIANPTTMPHYLKNQNDLAMAQIEKTNNLTEQMKFQNELIARQSKEELKRNSVLFSMAETVTAVLPALVIQLQEVSKIASVISISSDIEIAYREVSLVNHTELIKTLGAITTAMNTSTETKTAYAELSLTNHAELVRTISVIASNLSSVSNLATYQTTVASITDLDGNVLAQLSPQELSSYKDFSLARAKEKEKEIGDYQTTPVAIKNLDGNTVATAKPMEITAIKDAVNTKNETDEMEFELDEETLDYVFSPLPLPGFTKATLDEDYKEIIEGM